MLNDIDEMIGKYLAGECTPQEVQSIEAWLNTSEQNRQYFQQFKVIFERAAAVKDFPVFDTDAAWQKMKSRMGAEAKVVKLEERGFFDRYWRVAAAILVLMTVGLATYYYSTPVAVEVVSDAKTATDTLPDGSAVVLNRETKLAYSFNKIKKEHRVKLEGEAYFNIQHQGDKTFIVEVEDTFIKDIGTSFNVKAYPDNETIEVVVEEGEVMFFTEKDSGIYLKAGGKGIYDKKTKTFSVEEAEPNVAAYKTKFFIFNDQDLASVVENLNAVYDKKISISPELKNCRVNVSFNNESIEEIAAILAETLSLTVREESLQIILEGKGCQ